MINATATQASEKLSWAATGMGNSLCSPSQVRPAMTSSRTGSSRPSRNEPITGDGNSSATPRSATGTTNRPNSGTSTMFATGAGAAAGMSNAERTGQEAALIHNCMTTALLQRGRPTVRACVAAIVATAPNDSQKPAETAALGSTISTQVPASPSTSVRLPCRRRIRAKANTHSMIRARCVGSVMPASNA